MDALLRAIARAKRNHSLFAVMYIDIDNFKAINDRYGHGMGDFVICEVANRLTNVSRGVDLLARLGGDEFGILLEDIIDEEEIRAIAGRYINAFSEPLLLNDVEVVSKISIGVAMYPEHGTTSKQMLDRADKNLYIAKKQGKSKFVL